MPSLELLNSRYGHVAGADDFFKRLSKKKKRGKLMYYFASHPHPEDRIRALDRLVKENGCSKGEKSEVDKELLGSEDGLSDKKE